jgi:hypothetical protein
VDNQTIVTNFNGNPIDPQPDQSGDTAGTDITQHDKTFTSASFTNGNGGSPAAATLTCSSTSHPCKLKIHYKN